MTCLLLQAYPVLRLYFSLELHMNENSSPLKESTISFNASSKKKKIINR